MNPPSTMRRDLVSAYGAAIARIVSWVVVSAVVYRKLGAPAFALLTLIRATVGLLGYSALGIAPAMVAKLARSREGTLAAMPVEEEGPVVLLGYESRQKEVPPEIVYGSGLRIILWMACFGLLAATVYAWNFGTIHVIPPRYARRDMLDFLVLSMSAGVILRVVSEVPAAVLQTRDRIATDNLFVIAGEIAWAVMSVIAILINSEVESIGLTFFTANLMLAGLRFYGARRLVGPTTMAQWDRNVAIDLLGFGSLVVLAQLADYLYAPTDYILINRLLSAVDVATYAPAVQVDAGLLLLVSGLAAVLLPRAAMAHAAENRAALRKYYLLGTVSSLGLLIVAAGFVWGISSLLFRVWFGNSLPATRMILPLILIHTIIGGSSSVGRAILLGMGKVKPFTTAVLIAGVTNVLLSWFFVAVCGLGLRGIILGTIVAVVGRCGVWMPWYVMRVLGNPNDETRMSNE